MEYKKITESTVPESLTLPKIEMKDFAPYLDSIRDVNSLSDFIDVSSLQRKS